MKRGRCYSLEAELIPTYKNLKVVGTCMVDPMVEPADELDFSQPLAPFLPLASTLKRPHDDDTPMDEETYVPPEKRLCQVSVPQAEDAEGVFSYALNWLIGLQSWNRPKTRTALLNSLKSVCHQDFSVSSHTIMWHLFLNGLIKIHTPEDIGTKVITILESHQTSWTVGTPLQIFVPNDPLLDTGINSRVSDDFRNALSKVAAWLRSNRGLQGKTLPETSFLASLKQLCRMKRVINLDRVYDSMAKRGFVSQDWNTSELCYHLPTSVIKHGHYMSSPNLE